MPTIAIAGAGLIGRSWALVFARGGWDVRLTDPSPAALEAAPRLIREGLDELAAYKIVDDAAGAAARVSVAMSLAEAVEGVDLVQENGPERVEDKRRIFSELDAAAPRDAILASSTSAIVASKFSEDLPGRERCLVAHPVNPPHLVPIVELCGAPWTSPEVIARARRITRASTSADHGESRDRRLCPQPAPGRAALRGVSACRRWRGQPARPRQDSLGRARLALVLHGPVPDDRAQRAGASRTTAPATATSSAARPQTRLPRPYGTRRTSPASCRPGAGRRRTRRLRAAPPGATSASRL
jgi:hypothetical protein